MARPEPAWYAELRNLCDGKRSYDEMCEVLGQKYTTLHRAVLLLGLPTPPHASRKVREAGGEAGSSRAEQTRQHLLQREEARRAAGQGAQQRRAAAQQERDAEVVRRVEAGESYTQVGRSLKPPLTRARIGQIVQEQAKLQEGRET